MAMRTVHERHDDLLRELTEERAAALMRISRTLQLLIDRLHEARERVSTLTGRDRGEAMREYDALREQAKQYRWYLEVQRESVGLRSHEGLDQFYKIPGQLPTPNS
jgi:hypothetical protein